MTTSNRRNGFTIAELLAAIIAFLILLGVAGVLFADGSGGAKWISMREKDAAQVRQIHHAFVIWSGEDMDRYPIPGLIRRHPIDLVGDGNVKYIPGQGAEDEDRNTTANVYSAVIVRNYFMPETVVSPLERNPNVRVHGDFNYASYNPAQSNYWDDTFVADLVHESHASYAHLVLHGMRKRVHWRNTFDSFAPVLSNRGPAGGRIDPTSLTCNLDGTWSGHVVFADNAVRLLDTMTPQSVMYAGPEGERWPDNIFALDSNWSGADFILSFTLSVEKNELIIQHD